MERPLYQGFEVARVARLTAPGPNDQAIWYWTPVHIPLKADGLLRSRLHEEGYRPLPEHQRKQILLHLVTQGYEVRVWKDEAGEQHTWAKKEALAQVAELPVALVFTLDFAGIEVPSDLMTLPMLQFLPPPRLGEIAIIEEKREAYVLYHIEQVSEEIRERQRALREALEDLAQPGSWYQHRDLHQISADAALYAKTVADLSSLLLSSTEDPARAGAKEGLQLLQEAQTQLNAVQASWLKLDWLVRWNEIRTQIQALAGAYYQWHQEQGTTPSRLPATRLLPDLTSSQTTMLPSSNAFRALSQSFSPGLLSPSLWNMIGQEQHLATPNGSVLRIRGQEEYERQALYEYVNEMMGTEGLKHLLVLLDAYYVQTGGQTRMVDARVSLRQLLLRMGYVAQADVLEERRKLAHSILYLARTWVSSTEQRSDKPSGRGRGRRRARGIEWSPLLVIEKMQSSADGGLDVPEEVKFHLGEDFYEALFGKHQQFFRLPTAQVFAYHAVRQQQELVLAFYLSNMVIVASPFLIHFRELLIKSALRQEQDLDHDPHRTRNVLRVIFALERLEIDGLIIRAAHEDLDLILATELQTGEGRSSDFSPASLLRIETAWGRVQAWSTQEAKTRRRQAVQRLLKPENVSSAISFSAGRLLRERLLKRKDPSWEEK